MPTFATFKIALRLIAMLALSTPVGGCGIYSADPITARVIDADTGAPLEGVHVVAAWEVKGGLEGGNIEGYLKVMETITDGNGQFRFPGWGPRINPYLGGIKDEAPALMFLKRGYSFKTDANMTAVTAVTPSHMTSQWNGKTIALKRESSSPDQRTKDFDFLTMYTDNLRAYGDHWGAIPSFLCEMGALGTSLAAEGITHGSHSLEDLERDYGVRCHGKVDRRNVK